MIMMRNNRSLLIAVTLLVVLALVFAGCGGGGGGGSSAAVAEAVMAAAMEAVVTAPAEAVCLYLPQKTIWGLGDVMTRKFHFQFQSNLRLAQRTGNGIEVPTIKDQLNAEFLQEMMLSILPVILLTKISKVG